MVNFGTTTLTADSQTIFVAKYVARYAPTDGAFDFVTQLGGVGADGSMGVAVDGGGNIAAAGYFSATVDFGLRSLTAPGTSKDAVVLGLRP